VLLQSRKDIIIICEAEFVRSSRLRLVSITHSGPGSMDFPDPSCIPLETGWPGGSEYVEAGKAGAK
jgi:hypothetical protein